MQKERHILVLITVVVWLITNNLYAQENGTVTSENSTLVSTRNGSLSTVKGKIVDETKKDALIGVNVTIKGTTEGAITDEKGEFTITTEQPFPLNLIVSLVGYASKEIKVTDSLTIGVKLREESNLIKEVVVSASRVSEKILQSPVSIEKLDNVAIRQTAAPSFFDALENIKGVQMTTLSLGFKVPNTRGFTNTTNSRFLQLVDGADTQSPGIGAPIANAVGPSELDVQSVELIPGAASAIYGMNAINGVSYISTKDPFLHKGISIYQKVGLNHIKDANSAIKPLTETALRIANTVKDRFAYKINVSYFKAYDWIADDKTDLNATSNERLGLTGEDNPGKDPINSYGNESTNRKDIVLRGKTYQIARTGYYEKDFIDYNVQNLKGDVLLAYKFKNDDVLSYTYRVGTADNVYQRGNRIKLDGILLQQHKLEWTGKHHFFRTYLTTENTGDSYNARPMAENLERNFKSDTKWYSDFSNRFNALTTNSSTGDSILNALELARSFADSGRYAPYSELLNEKLKALAQINNWDRGAGLKLVTKLFQVEGQYDFSHLVKYFDLLAGVEFRDQNVTPDGNSFINPIGINKDGSFDSAKLFKNFNYYKVGGFFQATKTVWKDRIKFVAALRVDKVQYFKPAVNPRLAVVISPTPKHNFRISWQNGFRFPTLFEGFSFVDNGGVKRLGGLEVLAGDLNIVENSYLRNTVRTFNNAVKDSTNTGRFNEVQAIEANKGLLVKSPFGYIKPERINSLEIGYKGLFYKDRIFVDVDYYFNIYHNFIGQVEVTRINKGVIGVDDSTVYYARSAGSFGKNTNFRLWTNSAAVVQNHGISAAVSYNFWRTFTFSANYSWAKLKGIKNTDILIPAFNTPEHTVNLSLSAKEAFKNFGFNITWRWQSKFYWDSQLAAGYVPSFNTLDAQVNYRVPKAYSTFKVGGTNLLNKYYTQYIGGPAIGALLYFSWTVEGLLDKK